MNLLVRRHFVVDVTLIFSCLLLSIKSWNSWELVCFFLSFFTFFFFFHLSALHQVLFLTWMTLSAVHPNTHTRISQQEQMSTLTHNTHYTQVALTHTFTCTTNLFSFYHTHTQTYTHINAHLWWPYPPHFLLALINLTIHSSSAPHRRLCPAEWNLI